MVLTKVIEVHPQKCSFEETPDIIARAALFGELDKIQSVSANIMLGQEVPIGTGATELLFDEEKFFQNIVVSKKPVEEKQVDIDESERFKSAYCDNLF